MLRESFEKSPQEEIPTKIMFCRHGSNFSSPIIVGTLKASRIKMFLIAYTALNHLQVFDEHDWQQLPDLCSTLHVTVLKRVSTLINFSSVDVSIIKLRWYQINDPNC